MTITVYPSPASPAEVPIRVVALEEHYATPEYLAATEQFLPQAATSAALHNALVDLDDARIAAMDAGGIDVQVLSLAAGAQHRLAPSDA
ncbi:MAG: hypothetical protein WCE30_15110, partial [Mycobacterium sp.]